MEKQPLEPCIFLSYLFFFPFKKEQHEALPVLVCRRGAERVQCSGSFTSEHLQGFLPGLTL